MFILSRLKIESALIKQAQEGVDPVEKNAAENLKNLLLVHPSIISRYLCVTFRRLHYPPFKQLRLEEKALFKLCCPLSCYLYTAEPRLMTTPLIRLPHYYFTLARKKVQTVIFLFREPL